MIDPRQDPAATTTNPNASETELNTLLQAFNEVQPPARLEQRIHARLASEKFPTPSAAWRFAAAFTWPRAAFATATFAAGAIAATLLLPLTHPAVTVPVANHAAPATASDASVVKTADVHPALTIRAPGGRAAALNSASTVASARSRREHSDTQLAANRTAREKAQARLTRPAAPSAEPVDSAPTASQPDTQPAR